MFLTGMFEKEQSFACLKQPPLLHAHSHFSEPVREESIFIANEAQIDHSNLEISDLHVY